MRKAFNKLIKIITVSRKKELDKLKAYLKKFKMKDWKKENSCRCGIVPRQKIVKIIENTLKQIAKNNQNKEIIIVCADCEKQIAQIKKAVNTMVECNLRFVNSIVWEIKAKYYVPDSLHIIDLIQAGNIGLIRAIYPFYYKLGRITTYVNWEIKQIIQQKIRTGDTISLPLKIWELHRRCKIALSWAEKEGKSLKTIKDAAISLGLSEKDKEKILDIPPIPKSLQHEIKQHKIKDKEKGKLADIIPDLSVVQAETISADNEIILKTRALIGDNEILNPKEEKIIRLRFGINEKDDSTLEEIGKRFGVSREAIRQAEAKAMEKLEKAAKQQNLLQLL